MYHFKKKIRLFFSSPDPTLLRSSSPVLLYWYQ